MTRLDDQREDVFVEIIDMDTTAEEMVTENADGSYTIFINARIAFNRQQEAVEHAIRHIKDQDFEKTDVQQIEAAAHHIEPPVVSDEEIKRQKWEKKRAARLRKLRRERKKLQKEIDERSGFMSSLFMTDPDLYDRDFVGWR